jgi:hypothetical protein
MKWHCVYWGKVLTTHNTRKQAMEMAYRYAGWYGYTCRVGSDDTLHEYVY